MLEPKKEPGLHVEPFLVSCVCCVTFVMCHPVCVSRVVLSRRHDVAISKCPFFCSFAPPYIYYCASSRARGKDHRIGQEFAIIYLDCKVEKQKISIHSMVNM